MGTAGWVVVLEAQPTDGDATVEIARLQRLLEHMPGVEPMGLHSAERVAVQLHVDAPCAADAMSGALADLRAGLSTVGLENLAVIRAEVLSWGEYERDCRLAYAERAGDVAAQGLHGGDYAGRTSEQLLRQAFEDPLTRLPGRGLFMDHLEQALRVRPGGAIEEQAVVVLSLAGTGAVNERWGRSAGDEVLAESAKRLTSAMPPGMVAGRIAGDEFAVLVGGASQAEAQAIASSLLDALARPVPIVDIEVAPSARAGIAVGRPGQDAGELLAQARAAARAASTQSEPLVLFRPEFGPIEPLRLQVAVVHDPMGYLLLMLRAAMAANESSDLGRAAGLVVDQVCAQLGFQLGHLYVVAGCKLVAAKLARLAPTNYADLLDFLDHQTIGPGEGLAGQVLQSGKPAWVTDICSAEPSPWRAQAAALGFNAALAFPVLVGREVAGVLEFFAEHARVPDDELVEVLCCLGSQLGRVVERQRALLRPAGDDRHPGA